MPLRGDIVTHCNIGSYVLAPGFVDVPERGQSIDIGLRICSAEANGAGRTLSSSGRTDATWDRYGGSESSRGATMRFGTLIESRRTSRLAVRQALFSFSLHGALLLGAVALSGNAVRPMRVEPALPIDITFTTPPGRTSTAQPLRGTHGPSLPTIPTPSIEPVPLLPDLPVSSSPRWDPREFARPGAGALTGSNDLGSETLEGTFLPGEVDVMPRIAPGSRCSGEFPTALKAAGISGSVVLQFVIGTEGTVDRSAVRIVRSSSPALEQAAISGLTSPDCRYFPAESRGRPVAVLVQQSIRFALE